MARIRTIKPEFWRHEDLCEQPEATHMFAAALLNYADDFGYFNANPGLIRGEIYPLREPSVSIPESLRRLQTIGYVRIGTGSDGRRYGHVVHFDQHQRVSHPTASKISCISIVWDDSGISPENTSNPPETFVPERNREQGTGNGKEHDSALRAIVVSKPVAEIPEWIPPEAWAGFVEMRKKIRQPLTERGVLLTISALKKLRHTEDIGAVLDQSTMNNYRGVFPVKQDGNSNGQRTRQSAHDKHNAGAALFIASLSNDHEQRGQGEVDGDADGTRLPLLAS